MIRAIIYICVSLFVLTGCASLDLSGISPHMGMISTAASSTAKASRQISDEEEYYVGRSVAARIISTYPMYRNKKSVEYINTIGTTLSLYSEKPFTHGGYHFAVLDSDEINAFACPGGTIFITKGMLNTVKNEEELAAVLAHEIAHVNHRDGISSIKKSRWTEALTVIGSQAAKQYGPQELSQLVNIFEGSIDDVVKTLVVNGYGKTQEYDADKSALIYLAKAGYNPDALKNFLEKLVSLGKESGGGILKTHPATSDRIENVKDNMPKEKPDLSFVSKRTERFKAVF